MYSCEMFATNLAFQEGDLIFVVYFHCEILAKRHFLNVLKPTDSLFFSLRWKPFQQSIQNPSTVEMASV